MIRRYNRRLGAIAPVAYSGFKLCRFSIEKQDNSLEDSRMRKNFIKKKLLGDYRSIEMGKLPKRDAASVDVLVEGPLK